MKRNLNLAIDFDGTITSTNAWPKIEGLADNVKEVINSLHDEYNVTIIIWTCRDNTWYHDLDDAIQFLKENDIHYDYINENPVYLKNTYGSDPRKVFSDFYIDDRSFLFEKIDWIKIKNFILDFKETHNNKFN